MPVLHEFGKIGENAAGIAGAAPRSMKQTGRSTGSDSTETNECRSSRGAKRLAGRWPSGAGALRCRPRCLMTICGPHCKRQQVEDDLELMLGTKCQDEPVAPSVL
jgi:hypothetical protein